LDYSVTLKDLQELSDKEIVLWTLFCTNRVSHLWWRSDLAKACVYAVEGYINNRTSPETCNESARTLMNSIHHMTLSPRYDYAIRSAAYVAYTAGHIIYSTNPYACNTAVTCANYAHSALNNKQRERFNKETWEYYNELNTINNIFEDIVLKGNV
jgi:hypothetical protein